MGHWLISSLPSCLREFDSLYPLQIRVKLMSLDFYIAASVIFAIIVVGFIVSNVIILIDKQKNKDYLTQYWSELRDKDHDS